MSLTKFHITEKTAIKDYYDSHGYVVIEDLLSSSKIQDFLDCYEKIKHSKFFVFFSQDTHLPTLPRLTPEGFIENSMLYPASLKLWRKFALSVEECLVDESVTNALSVLSGASSHVMMQNMFFDKSTGTIEHQDHYYLDSDPPGQMVAAWYSLEDIHEDAGCFFVLPGSHKGKVIERDSGSNFSDHDTFVKQISTLIHEGNYEYRSFPLKRGDVLFWHPYTIHGAHTNQDPRFSRKSLTAHYYPAHLQTLYSRKAPADRKKAPKTRKTVNPTVTILGSEWDTYISNSLHYLRFISNYFRGRGPDYDMRRASYSEQK
jgi:phytanoyl-CoA hydroxylase